MSERRFNLVSWHETKTKHVIIHMYSAKQTIPAVILTAMAQIKMRIQRENRESEQAALLYALNVLYEESQLLSKCI